MFNWVWCSRDGFACDHGLAFVIAGGVLSQRGGCGNDDNDMEVVASSLAAHPDGAGSSAARGALWPVYVLQPVDLDQQKVVVEAQSQSYAYVDWVPRRGRLVREEDAGVHAYSEAVYDILNEEYTSAPTAGDGACGLHAMYGEPNASGSLECPDAQDRAATLLDPPLHMLRQRRSMEWAA